MRAAEEIDSSGSCPSSGDGGAELVEVGVAARAQPQVLLERRAVLGGQLALEVRRHELDERLAVHRRHPLAAEGRAFVVALQVGPDDGAAAVQQHALVAGSDRQQLADLLGRVPVEVAQGDHHPLARRQLVQRARDDLVDLAGQERLLGPLVGEPAPAAGVRVAGALEAARVDGRPVTDPSSVGQARERHGPAFADSLASWPG